MKKTLSVPDRMRVPEGEAAYDRHLPLWLQVAQWCLSRKAPVNRQAIAQAFAIPQRQAADTMLYITGRRGDVVQARRRVAVMPGGIREATLEVLSICDDPLPARGAGSHQAPRGRRRAEGAVPSSLRDLVLGRRRPGDST